MPSKLNPYISFKDNAREAMEFYETVFGGTLLMNTFKEFQASHGPDDENLIMHAMLESKSGFTLMGADTPDGMEYNPGTNMSISLSGDDEAELRGYWDGLSAGATIAMPLEKAPWGDTFGMLVDKFGVSWMVNITGQQR